MTIDRWLALIGVLLGAAGCVLAVWFYRRSEKKRIPTFVVHPNKRLLAHPALAQVELMSIQHNNRNVGNNGITELQIHFWNSGNLPLLQSDILEQFAIHIPATILYFEVIKLSRSVVHLQLSRSTKSDEELILSFTVLEPGDGGTLRIVYDGLPEEPIAFTGACVGAMRPTVLPSDPMYFSSISNRIYNAFEIPIMVLLITGVVFPTVFGITWVIRRLFGERVLVIVSLVVMSLLLIWVVTTVIWNQYKRITAKYVPPDVRTESQR